MKDPGMVEKLKVHLQAVFPTVEIRNLGEFSANLGKGSIKRTSLRLFNHILSQTVVCVGDSILLAIPGIFNLILLPMDHG